jgi:hypothetical protein
MWIDFLLYIGYGLIIFAVGAAIVFPLIQGLKDPKSLVKPLIGIGAIVVFFVIGYVLSSGTVTASWAAKGITEGSSKLIGAGLIMFYIVLGLAVVSVIYSEISKALK